MIDIHPDSACTTKSYPGRRLSAPKPLIEHQINSGRRERVLDCDREAVERAGRLATGDDRVGSVCLGQRALGVQRHHGVDRRVELLDPAQIQLEQLPAGNLAPGQRRDQGRCGSERIDVALVPTWVVTSQSSRQAIERWVKPRQVVAFHVGEGEADRASRQVGAAMPGAITLTRERETHRW